MVVESLASGLVGTLITRGAKWGREIAHKTYKEADFALRKPTLSSSTEAIENFDFKSLISSDKKAVKKYEKRLERSLRVLDAGLKKGHENTPLFLSNEVAIENLIKISQVSAEDLNHSEINKQADQLLSSVLESSSKLTDNDSEKINTQIFKDLLQGKSEAKYLLLTEALGSASKQNGLLSINLAKNARSISKLFNNPAITQKIEKELMATFKEFENNPLEFLNGPEAQEFKAKHPEYNKALFQSLGSSYSKTAWQVNDVLNLKSQSDPSTETIKLSENTSHIAQIISLDPASEDFKNAQTSLFNSLDSKAKEIKKLEKQRAEDISDLDKVAELTKEIGKLTQIHHRNVFVLMQSFKQNPVTHAVFNQKMLSSKLGQEIILSIAETQKNISDSSKDSPKPVIRIAKPAIQTKSQPISKNSREVYSPELSILTQETREEESKTQGNSFSKFIEYLKSFGVDSGEEAMQDFATSWIIAAAG